MQISCFRAKRSYVPGRLLTFGCCLFLPCQGFAQPTKPAKGQKFIPPIFGTWQTGQLLAVEGDSLTPAIPFDCMYDKLRLLPAGVVVEFKIGFDKVALESYYEMTLVPPFPPESCNYGTLWTSLLKATSIACTAQTAHQHF